MSNSAERRLWGKQTDLALTHFKIGNELMPPPLIHAYGIVKFCAAACHRQHGLLDADITEAIMQAAQQLQQGL